MIVRLKDLQDLTRRLYLKLEYPKAQTEKKEQSLPKEPVVLTPKISGQILCKLIVFILA